MGTNVLPFAARTPVESTPRAAAARLVFVARTARLALTIAPRPRTA